MILPFVRELLADLERSPAFEQAARHLSLARGRRRVSGLTATARALYLPFFAKAAQVPAVVLVADNKAADALFLSLRSACELTGVLAPDRVLKLPAHDVLPFEHMSPHAEVQEQRAATLWKIASGAASVVIAPVEAAAMKLFPAAYYSDLARTIKRGEEHDLDELTTHLASVGYMAMDIVEMPGQYTRRGGILDVYSPEAERPVRFEFFGDEVESIRRFDPDSQRSLNPLDEAILLPLTETPINERLLAAVHTRLSGSRLDEADLPELVERSIAAGGVSVFPGWEFFAGVAGASTTLLGLFPRCVLFVEEPGMIRNQVERWWNKIEQRHDRSGIGSLVQPADIYREPELLRAADLASRASISTSWAWWTCLKRTTRWARWRLSRGRRCASTDRSRRWWSRCATLMEQETRMLLVSANQGEMERMGNLLREYEVPYRLGWRSDARGQPRWASYDRNQRAGELHVPALMHSQHCERRLAAEATWSSSARTISLTTPMLQRAPAAKKSKTAAFVSDFRDLTVNDYVVHVEHGIAKYMGLREIEQDGVQVEFMILEFADAARLYVPLTRLDLIQKYRSSDAVALRRS